MEETNFDVALEQKKLKDNQYLYLEFYYNLSLIVTRNNIYVDSWEEGNYPMRNGMLPIMTRKEKEKYDDILYHNYREDIETTYKILDKIFDTCKYHTVECWEVG